jgi:hypothetical protein
MSSATSVPFAQLRTLLSHKDHPKLEERTAALPPGTLVLVFPALHAGVARLTQRAAAAGVCPPFVNYFKHSGKLVLESWGEPAGESLPRPSKFALKLERKLQTMIINLGIVHSALNGANIRLKRSGSAVKSIRLTDFSFAFEFPLSTDSRLSALSAEALSERFAHSTHPQAIRVHGYLRANQWGNARELLLDFPFLLDI